MRKKLHVKTGDTVIVISGNSKGVIGKVVGVSPKEDKVIVEGANIVKKHVKARPPQEAGGIIEAPALQVPTVNIGDRQKGRLMAESIVNCLPEQGAILKAMEEAMKMDLRGFSNPYGDGTTSEQIVSILEGFFRKPFDLKKGFYDIQWSEA